MRGPHSTDSATAPGAHSRSLIKNLPNMIILPTERLDHWHYCLISLNMPLTPNDSTRPGNWTYCSVSLRSTDYATMSARQFSQVPWQTSVQFPYSQPLPHVTAARHRVPHHQLNSSNSHSQRHRHTSVARWAGTSGIALVSEFLVLI